MKTFILSAVIACVAFMSCEAPKNAATPTSNDVTLLEGSWELNYITGPRIAFDGLYPNKKPTLVVNVADKRISGNTGCNAYSGPLVAEKSSISFTGPIAVTKMMCVDGALGEKTYLEMLKKVNTFSVSGGTTLNLIAGDIILMSFIKK